MRRRMNFPGNLTRRVFFANRRQIHLGPKKIDGAQSSISTVGNGLRQHGKVIRRLTCGLCSIGWNARLKCKPRKDTVMVFRYCPADSRYSTNSGTRLTASTASWWYWYHHNKIKTGSSRLYQEHYMVLRHSFDSVSPSAQPVGLLLNDTLTVCIGRRL
jgi:hypothetical protein